MANIDLGFRTGDRPFTVVQSYRRSLAEELSQSRPAQSLPKFSRIDGGQLLRSLILVALCVGIVQLTRIDNARPEKADAPIVTPKHM